VERPSPTSIDVLPEQRRIEILSAPRGGEAAIPIEMDLAVESLSR
jgi:hypothetical protein